MNLLILGVGLFVFLHLIPCVPPLRNVLAGSFGESRYKILFALLTVASIVLIVQGFGAAPFEPVYQPAIWGRTVAIAAVPLAFVLFAAANMPTHIRKVVRHPMLAGLFLWAIAHLAANGDMRSVILFGTFGVYAVVATLSAVARGKNPDPTKPARFMMDAIAVVAGLAAAGVVVHFHAALFGMPVV